MSQLKLRNGSQGNTGYVLDDSDPRSAKLAYDRIVLEEQAFDGKLTELIFHKIVAQMDGKELTTEEEQKIISSSLENRVRYARSTATLFENNRDALVRFENHIWEMISKII
jgi:hypothetical protein